MCFAEFRRLLLHPGAYSLAPHYDGIKSDYSIAALLRQPLSDGALIRGHNYPYGEYLYYTDTTPILLAPLHLLVRLVPALAPYGLHLYRLAIILLVIPLSTWLLAKLLRGFGLPAVVAVLLCGALPWLAPHTWRLGVGHMSLAVTPAVLATLLCLRRLGEATAPAGARRWRWALAVTMGAAAWLHFYYLLMLPMLAGTYALVVAGDRWRAGEPLAAVGRWFAPIVAAVVGVVGLTMAALLALDPWTAIRPKSSGYGWVDWKMQFGGWFRAPDHFHLRFLLEPSKVYPYEPAQYLGGFVLYGLLLAGGAWWLTRRRRTRQVSQETATPPAPGWPALSAEPAGRFVRAALLAAVPLALISIGEQYELDGGAYLFNNYLNPFFWLRKLIPQLAQFRALARFAWPLWWALNLLVIWGVGRLWSAAPTTRGYRLRWLALLPLTWLLVDTRDATHFYRRLFAESPDPLADPAAGAALPALLDGTRPAQYQALLTLPFYHVGADGNYEYTIDPDEIICTRSYQLGLLTNLPLLAHKATRTPPVQARALWSLFNPTGPPDADLLARLQVDPRPILVYLDTSYYDGSNPFYRQALTQQPEHLAWIEQGDDFIRQRHLRRLGKVGKESCYVWFPRQEAPGAVLPPLPSPSAL